MGDDIDYYIYHVIEDVDTKKIYAIFKTNTNVLLEITSGNTKLLKGNGIRNKNWKEVNFNEEGSFWIDEELPDYYQNNGENISIKYLNKTHTLNITDIHNRNQNYDISLLNKAIFITGYAEFDLNRE